MPELTPPTGYIPVQSALTGITVFAPAPPDSGPQQEVVDFNCPQCGATTAFSASGGGLTCAHCGYFEAPEQPAVGRKAEQFEFTVETMERSAQGWGAERKELVCQNCGALTSIPADSLAHTCTFCGSNKVIQRQAAQDALRPRYVVPFKLEDKACAGIAQQWLGSSWMTPAALKSLAALGRFTAIYLPYWTFGAATRADWKAEVGHDEKERYFENGEWKERTVTKWRWESGHVNLTIRDLLVPGAGRLSKRLMDGVGNFDLAALAPYEPKYLAGLQAQAYDVPLEKAWESGRDQMREQTRQACIAQASTSKVRNFSMQLDFADETWRYVLLPVYLTTYRYENQTYQVMINGQTGSIEGQRPVDWQKIWLVIALLLAPGLCLGLAALVMLPFGGIGFPLGIIAFILLVAAVVVGLIIYTQADKLDDL